MRKNVHGPMMISSGLDLLVDDIEVVESNVGARSRERINAVFNKLPKVPARLRANLDAKRAHR